MPGSTPVYGFPYPEPTDLVADYPALGQQLAEDIEATLPTVGGLSPVSPTSIANSGGSASTTANTTTFTAVSSISLNGVFTSAFSHYRILFRYTATNATYQNFRLRSAGTDVTSTSYNIQQLIAGSTTILGNRALLNTGQIVQTAAGSIVAGTFDLFSPQIAEAKMAKGNFVTSKSGLETWNTDMHISDTTARDSMTWYTDAGTITGTISVFGYAK